MPTAPYGSWVSPVTVEMMTSASVGLGTPTLDGTDLYWTAARADEGGRTTLMRLSGSAAVVEVTPAPFDVRTRVHEYGGGEYAARAGVVVFSDLRDGRLYACRNGQPPTPLTPATELRFADIRLDPDHDRVLAVREDHRAPGEPVNTIVALELSGPNDAGGTVLCAGADFYASPELSADGRLAWTEWNHPAMPWDATLIRVAELDGTTLGPPLPVAGGPAESAVHPRWTPDGTLVFASDRSGWWNLYAWSDGSTRCLRAAEAEFAGPLWQLGQSPYAVVDDEHLLVTWSTGAAGSIGVLAMSSGALSPVAPERTSAASVTVASGSAAAVLSTPDGPPWLARLDLSTRQWTNVRRASEAVLEPAYCALAEAVTWSNPDGPVHGWYYPPTNGDHAAPAGALPPLITVSHGGPTAYSGAGFRLAVQYWTSRGIAVLDVNYGGSSGYGRSYRERLKGRWGLVDVADCAAGAVEMGRTGRADPARLAISGGSAGGYTTLRALTSTDVFAAGISRYGVGDLEGLARDTHKFESRYLDGLVGPYPDAIDTYRDRSPLHQVDRLSAPILLLQGADDQVVPLNQAETMAAAARAKGLPVALVVFPGEGHGFRRAENIRASLEAELTFLGRVFGFDPADDLPPLAIENLRPG